MLFKGSIGGWLVPKENTDSRFRRQTELEQIVLAVSTTASTILQANLLRVEHHRLVFVFPLIRTLVLFTTQLHIHTVRVHKFTAVRMGEWNSFHITKWDSRSKLDSEAISGWNKALETPLCAIRADQTYLFTSETKRSCKSLRVNAVVFFPHGTAYGNRFLVSLELGVRSPKVYIL